MTLQSSPPHHFIIVIVILLPCLSSSSKVAPPPLPVLPVPTNAQLQWQTGEMAMFLHFGMNTFTDSEWGTGTADPTVFSPNSLNATQWAEGAKDAGFSRMVLTAKHHDGFCLWPSKYTDYSVENSGGGMRDVVGDAAAAARDQGIGFGIYLSPWDLHEECYGNSKEYNEFYLGQMAELLTSYGEITEVFLDGAPGKNSTATEYSFPCWFDFIHQLQPNAVIFSDSGPDSRWIGDEAGIAGPTCWSPFNTSIDMIGNTTFQYSTGGDPQGRSWVPAECDVSIRPGWFWHSDEHPKSPMELLDIYYKSVGRNCFLILNVPPNSSGLISDEDLQALHEFTKIRHSIFAINLAQDAVFSSSSTRGGGFKISHVLEEGLLSYWAPAENQPSWEVHVDLQKPVTFNVLHVGEPIQMGQRISKFRLDVLIEDEWHTTLTGTTVGYKRLLLFPKVEARFIKLVIAESRADPLLSYFAIHLDEFTDTSEWEEAENRFIRQSAALKNNSSKVASFGGAKK